MCVYVYVDRYGQTPETKRTFLTKNGALFSLAKFNFAKIM